MNNNPHPHLVRGCLACHYQNLDGSSVFYDYNDRNDRKRALSQLAKKKGRIDPELMEKAFDRYQEILQKEFQEYLESL